MRATIDALIGLIAPLDKAAMRGAQERLDQLTKPRASLGRLEELVVRLAGITGRTRQRFPNKTVVLVAADHGVAEEGVSAYPQPVTAQMVANFLRGGAAINVLARQKRARVVVVDMGVAAELPSHPNLVTRKIAWRTGNIARGPAMTQAEALAAIEAGLEIAGQEIAQGADLLATGDMGIGNTTPSSAIASVLLGRCPAEVTGRGTGVNDAVLAHKIAVIERAIQVNQPDPSDPLGVLAKLGGYEIAGLVGVILKGAAERVPIVIDGFISGAASLVAAKLCPTTREYLLAGHCSMEPGHRLILEDLGLRPLLDLELRLGEGTGSVLSMHLVDNALALMDEMATFEEAGVADRSDSH